MKQKLIDEVIKNGHAETNRFFYIKVGNVIMKKPKEGLQVFHIAKILKEENK